MLHITLYVIGFFFELVGWISSDIIGNILCQVIGLQQQYHQCLHAWQLHCWICLFILSLFPLKCLLLKTMSMWKVTSRCLAQLQHLLRKPVFPNDTNPSAWMLSRIIRSSNDNRNIIQCLYKTFQVLGMQFPEVFYIYPPGNVQELFNTRAFYIVQLFFLLSEDSEDNFLMDFATGTVG